MIFEGSSPPPDALRRAIAQAYRADEGECVSVLLAAADLGPLADRRIAARAQNLVAAVRAGRQGAGGIDAFLQEYELSSQEGVVLMCLAEALLRIPDGETADRLIRDKLGDPVLGHPSGDPLPPRPVPSGDVPAGGDRTIAILRAVYCGFLRGVVA